MSKDVRFKYYHNRNHHVPLSKNKTADRFDGEPYLITYENDELYGGGYNQLGFDDYLTNRNPNGWHMDEKIHYNRMLDGVSFEDDRSDRLKRFQMGRSMNRELMSRKTIKTNNIQPIENMNRWFESHHETRPEVPKSLHGPGVQKMVDLINPWQTVPLVTDRQHPLWHNTTDIDGETISSRLEARMMNCNRNRPRSVV